MWEYSEDDTKIFNTMKLVPLKDLENIVHTSTMYSNTIH